MTVGQEVTASCDYACARWGFLEGGTPRETFRLEHASFEPPFLRRFACDESRRGMKDSNQPTIHEKRPMVHRRMSDRAVWTRR